VSKTSPGDEFGWTSNVKSSLKRVARACWNVVTLAEVSKSYPERVIAILWNALPERIRSWRSTQAIGRLVHRRVCRVQERVAANYYTRFFRNLPQLEVFRDLVLQRPEGKPLKVVSLGCSTGAELYSALWIVRTARPRQQVHALGIDLSERCIHRAAAGEYPLDSKEVARVSEVTYEHLFTRDRDTLRVQDWLREGVAWRVGNVCSPDLASELGSQDIVLANNFLFHMSPEQSTICLRNIARLTAHDGYLFIWGVDRDVRMRVVRDLGLVPVVARLVDIYTADESALKAWPLLYWGVEPMRGGARDWPLRYTTVFKWPDRPHPEGEPAGAAAAPP
jgi:chemotaxis methyl-accepting protein methylase